MLRFRRFSKQSYWEALKKTDKDDITISDDCDDGGCLWEFNLVELSLGGRNTAIQVKMFDDAVICLKNQKILLTLISLEKCNTLDNVEKILRRNGFEEAID